MEVAKLLESVPGTLSLAAGAAAAASWLYMAINGMQLWFHLKKPAPPRTSLWPRPSQSFTEEGLIIYRRAGGGLLGFFIFWFLAFILAGFAR